MAKLTIDCKDYDTEKALTTFLNVANVNYNILEEVEDESEQATSDPDQSQEIQNPNMDFLKAQLSIKHQNILRSILSLISAITVSIVFILEKLGIL